MRSEFDFIQNIKKKFGLDRIGDDCAVIPKDNETDLLVTADMLAEGIDFQLDWTSPEFLGHKALAVSLSDIAAMGGEARWALVSIGVPERLWEGDFLDRFYEGWHALAKETGVEMVGGDVSRSPGGLVIDSIVGGEVVKGAAVLRSGAQVGDAVYVTGWLGGARGGLEILEKRSDPSMDVSDTAGLIKRQQSPIPQLRKGLSLRGTGFVHAMIDVSDGFLSDLEHICEASLVGARISAAAIPVHYALKNVFDESTSFEYALNGGEDFELIFTADPEKIFAPKWDEISCVGEITSNTGKIELIRDGRTEIIEPKGYRHF